MRRTHDKDGKAVKGPAVFMALMTYFLLLPLPTLLFRKP